MKEIIEREITESLELTKKIRKIVEDEVGKIQVWLTRDNNIQLTALDRIEIVSQLVKLVEVLTKAVSSLKLPQESGSGAEEFLKEKIL